MPNIVFQVFLPLFWLFVTIGIAGNRWRLMRQLGRDPILIRPAQKTESPAGYLEKVLSVCMSLLTVDIILNAVASDAIAAAWAIRALRMSPAVGYIGLGLMATGFVLAAVAVRQMGESWRIGIDREKPGPFVSRGLYARVRHPIYTGMLLATAGIAGVTADLLSVSVAAAAWVGVPMQARLEEAFLLSRYPEEYSQHVGQTGRFWPRM